MGPPRPPRPREVVPRKVRPGAAGCSWSVPLVGRGQRGGSLAEGPRSRRLRAAQDAVRVPMSYNGRGVRRGGMIIMTSPPWIHVHAVERFVWFVLREVVSEPCASTRVQGDRQPVMRTLGRDAKSSWAFCLVFFAPSNLWKRILMARSSVRGVGVDSWTRASRITRGRRGPGRAPYRWCFDGP